MASRILIAVAFAAAPAWAYYLPGMSPIEYKEGGVVDLKVNKLTSVKTQLPYAYYTLPYCRPHRSQIALRTLGRS